MMGGAAGMASVWHWLLPLLAATIIFALYFLKLRRRPLLVPSTYLWRRTLEDDRTSALWRRLRQSLLLLLQLAAVALAAAALARPYWRANVPKGSRTLFLIDNSASMSAEDVVPTRLDEAKRRVLELVDQMHAADSATIVSFGRGVKIEQSATNDRALLRRAVESVRPTAEASNIDEAVALCSERNKRRAVDTETAESDDVPEQILIFSDGNFSNFDALAALGSNSRFVVVGTGAARNVGITQFAVSRNAAMPEHATALATIEHFGGESTSLEAELRCESKLVDARRIELAAADRKTITFALPDAPDGVYELRVAIDDCLAVDDRAWSVLAPPPKTRILLVTTGSKYLEAAMTTPEAARWARLSIRPPTFLNTPEYRAMVEGSIDLVIYDRLTPESPPPCHAVYFGAIPPGGRWQLRPAVEVPQVVDFARTHPLMHGVSLTGFLLAEGRPVVGPSGAQTLLDGAEGALAAIVSRQNVEEVVFGFALAAEDGSPLTNWPVENAAGFEQFTLNLAQHFGRRRREAAESHEPGTPVGFRLENPPQRVSVVGPDGSATIVARSAQGEFVEYATPTPGAYRVFDEDRLLHAFCVNLFDSRESSVAVGATAPSAVNRAEIDDPAIWESANVEGWRPFLFLMLALLVVEWYIYVNRAGAFPPGRTSG